MTSQSRPKEKIPAYPPAPQLRCAVSGAPTKIGIALFPQFELLDVAGPIEAFTQLARNIPEAEAMELFLLSHDLHPVSTGPPRPSKKDPEGLTQWPKGKNFFVTFTPTHTYDDPPEDLEILLIPGGIRTGPDVPEIKMLTEYIKRAFPKLKYLITVCTGAGIAAEAGVLNGLPATTNKQGWTFVTAQGPNTYWVGHSRWVESSDKIWTTSGVSAGTDGVLAFMSRVYGENATQWVANTMEWNRQFDPWHDSFGVLNHCQNVAPQQTPS